MPTESFVMPGSGLTFFHSTRAAGKTILFQRPRPILDPDCIFFRVTWSGVPVAYRLNMVQLFSNFHGKTILLVVVFCLVSV